MYFPDAVITMTANIDVRRTQHHAGFTSSDEQITELDSLKQVSPPESINRLDAVCAFNMLTRGDVVKIVRDITLRAWNEHNASSGIHVDVSGSSARISR